MTLNENLESIRNSVKSIKDVSNEMFDVIPSLTPLENYSTNLDSIRTLNDARGMFSNQSIDKINNILGLFSKTDLINFNSSFQNIANLDSLRDRCEIHAGNCENMFYGFSGTKIPRFDYSQVTSLYRFLMFSSAYITDFSNLLSINNNQNYYNCFQMCYSCSNIINFPETIILKPTNAQAMFYNCQKMEIGPTVQTEHTTEFSRMYYNCYTLKKIHIDVTSNLYTDGEVLPARTSGTSLLNDLVITATTTPSEFWSDGINIRNCSLDRTALVNLFTNLFTANPSWDTLKRSITITGNPGSVYLTAADKLIATNKNWIIVQ